jgi:hypothetical protein
MMKHTGLQNENKQVEWRDTGLLDIKERARGLGTGDDAWRCIVHDDDDGGGGDECH